MNSLDIRIFGIESRLGNIQKIKSMLPEDTKVVIDYNKDGCLKTSKKTWSLDTTCSHVLVLNDDVELCNGFCEICNKMINAQPECIFSLFSFYFMRGDVTNRSGGYPKKSPYIEVDSVSGAGIIMPSKFIAPCLNSWDMNIKDDDTNICNWAKKNNVRILTTLPGILQHHGVSSLGHPPLETAVFEKDPIANWDNSFITNWSNI